MKNAIVLLFAFAISFCLSNTAQAQKTATWKGGTPGQSVEWTCAANWKEGRVPNEFSNVVIPDVSATGSYQPVIRCAVEGVNSLTVLPGAQLRIEPSGTLEIFESLECIAGNGILNFGRLEAPLSETTGKEWNTALAAHR